MKLMEQNALLLIKNLKSTNISKTIVKFVIFHCFV